MKDDHAGATGSDSWLLIADDDAEMRWLVRAAVGGTFTRVVETADGRELFWELLRHSVSPPPDQKLVVVADVRMPVYDGLVVLEAAREELGLRVPLIVITSFPDAQLCERVARVGGRLLSKPFSMRRLRHLVKEVLH